MLNIGDKVRHGNFRCEIIFLVHPTNRALVRIEINGLRRLVNVSELVKEEVKT